MANIKTMENKREVYFIRVPAEQDGESYFPDEAFLVSFFKSAQEEGRNWEEERKCRYFRVIISEIKQEMTPDEVKEFWDRAKQKGWEEIYSDMEGSIIDVSIKPKRRTE